MKQEILRLCNDTIDNKGINKNVDCTWIKCINCPFSNSNNGFGVPCGNLLPHNTIDIAFNYISEHELRKSLNAKEVPAPQSSTNNINNPKHYNTGNIEVIEVIEDWKLNFNLGNAIKYIGRCEHKNNKQEDIKKAIWYLERELKSND